MVESQLLRAPKQQRSQRTTDRVLDALESLLRERSFEEITIRMLLERAGTSTGSFYARFSGKQALLPVLYDRHDARLHAAADTGPGDVAPAESLRAEVVRMTQSIVRRHRERRWFIRAVALHARTHPDLIPAEQRRRRAALHQKWHERLLRFRDEIGHPDPEGAVAFGFFMVVSTCREKIVFSDAPLATSVNLDDDALAEELARAFLVYLNVRAEGSN